MMHPSPELIAADLAKLINPGLRSPRADLAALPGLAAVQAELNGATLTVADAIEVVVNRSLDVMSAPGAHAGLPHLAADPVKALRAALALRRGSERIRSKTRRAAAAQAMGLLSGDGWRAHHEKGLLRDLADVICALDAAASGPAPRSVAGTAPDPGITRFYSDFVDIEGDWKDLFAASFTLDLAIMYGATWRNTQHKDLAALVSRPDGRLRVVLPDPSTGSPLATVYAATLGITPDDLRRKITEAIGDFRAIGPSRHVEIYLTSTVCRHAIYLFTHQAILALYALCGERIATPALRICEGGLLSFIRQDFDRLLEHSERIT